MSTGHKLSFAEFLNPDGAEFPYCCRSGFWMTYNTRLRDPARVFDAPNREPPEACVRKELARAKKNSGK